MFGRGYVPALAFGGREAAEPTLGANDLPAITPDQSSRSGRSRERRRRSRVRSRCAVQVSCSSTCRTTLGWQATVDGEDVPTQMLAPGMVGVPVPAGEHEVAWNSSINRTRTTGRSSCSASATSSACGGGGRRRRAARPTPGAIPRMSRGEAPQEQISAGCALLGRFPSDTATTSLAWVMGGTRRPAKGVRSCIGDIAGGHRPSSSSRPGVGDRRDPRIGVGAATQRRSGKEDPERQRLREHQDQGRPHHPMRRTARRVRTRSSGTRRGSRATRCRRCHGVTGATGAAGAPQELPARRRELHGPPGPRVLTGATGAHGL